MTSIDPAKLSTTQRHQAGVVTPLHPTALARPAANAAGGGAEVPVTLTGSTSAGPFAPVDADRVAEIRKAVAEGRYPLQPTRIADAMIAAGFLLRTPS